MKGVSPRERASPVLRVSLSWQSSRVGVVLAVEAGMMFP